MKPLRSPVIRRSDSRWFYDSNRVTIEGHTDLAFSDDVAARFLAYGWNVLQRGRCQRFGAARRSNRDFPP